MVVMNGAPSLNEKGFGGAPSFFGWRLRDMPANLILSGTTKPSATLPAFTSVVRSIGVFGYSFRVSVARALRRVPAVLNE